jgi:hypothetical protein
MMDFGLFDVLAAYIIMNFDLFYSTPLVVIYNNLPIKPGRTTQ